LLQFYQIPRSIRRIFSFNKGEVGISVPCFRGRNLETLAAPCARFLESAIIDTLAAPTRCIVLLLKKEDAQAFRVSSFLTEIPETLSRECEDTATVSEFSIQLQKLIFQKYFIYQLKLVNCIKFKFNFFPNFASCSKFWAPFTSCTDYFTTLTS
jgi:hypothetical protein